MELTPQQEQDVKQLEKFFEECKVIFIERMAKYGNSWREMKSQSIAEHIKMKAYRSGELGVENDKIHDEAHDIANYAWMMSQRAKETKND